MTTMDISRLIKDLSPSLETSLPPSLREMARAVGLHAVIDLTAWRGGVSLYVPHSLRDGHELSQRVGSVAALWLVYNHAGEVINVPLAADYLRRRRNQHIRARHNAGESAARIAQGYGLTERHVWRILSAGQVSGEAAPQHSLAL